MKFRSSVVAVSTDHEARESANAERALLGALLFDCATAWPQIKDITDLSHFAEPTHGLIFSAIASLIGEGEPVDPVLVIDRLAERNQLEAIGGNQYIAELYAETATAANVAAYAKIVRRHASRGKVVEIADVMAARARSLPVEDALRLAQEQIERARREHGDTERAPMWPAPLNLVSLLAIEPEKPRMIIDDWLPCGYATMIAGHGGAGKSSAALHLAAAIAQGRAWYGRSTAKRRVIYLSCEDRVDVIHWRLARICAYEGWCAADLSGSLVIRDLVGFEAILYRSSFDGLMPTRAYTELERIMRDDPSAVLIIDGVSDTYGGNENDRGQVKTFVNALVRLVDAEGAVLLVHHVNKQSANATSGSEGYSGSTGWHNSVRARWYLRPKLEEDEEGNNTRADGKLVLELQKTNHGRVDQHIDLHWDDAAHMFVPENLAGVSFSQRWGGADRSRAVEQCVLDAVARLTAQSIRVTDGKTSPDYLPKKMREMRITHDFTPRELGNALSQLRLAGKIVEGEVGKYGNRTPKIGLVVAP
jgi:hypothetical protein